MGLQNWGIDPLRDINHVKNQDLQQIFGEKVPMKGYSYLNCKSKKLKRRMEKLYKPLFQQPDLPKEGYVPESFARAAVSETLHFTSINWARLAAEKWQIRDAPNQIIQYKEGEENLTYKSVVLISLETEIQRMHDGLRVLEEEEDRAMKNVEVVRRSTDAHAGVDWNKKNNENLKKAKVKLQFELEDLEYSKSRTVALCASPEQLDLWATWSGKVDSLEESTKSLKQQIQDLESLCREDNQDTLDALENLRVIKEKVKDANAEIAKKRKILYELYTPSYRPISMNPSSFVLPKDMDNDMDPQKSTDLMLVGYIKPCALCTKEFPNKDVILAPCGCNYHPWCCVTQNWLSRDCADDNCKVPFTKAWKQSMGVFNRRGKSLWELFFLFRVKHVML